jgi:glycosyltransferase involved in cell wall biosynthesis
MMTGTNPLVSIVTPNYNYAKFIGETIVSVINQDYSFVEHVIVDDGSVDESVQIIESFVQKFPGRIRLIRQPNAGQTAAINTGLKNANGGILGWINSDDTYLRGTIRFVASFFASNPNVDVLIGDANVVDLKGRFIYRLRHLPFDRTTGCFLGFARITTSNAVFWRRKALEGAGYLNESLKCNMDGEYFSRLTCNRNVQHVSIPFANFRRPAVSKAGVGRTDWMDIVRQEVETELRASYSSLRISRVIPYRFSAPLRFVYRSKRVIMRASMLHYVLEAAEKYRYHTSHNHE